MSWLTLEGTRNGRDIFTVTIPLPQCVDPYADKRVEVALAMGERWVCDKARHVARGDYSQHESHGADVAATFARVRERMVPEKRLIIQEAEVRKFLRSNP